MDALDNLKIYYSKNWDKSWARAKKKGPENRAMALYCRACNHQDSLGQTIAMRRHYKLISKRCGYTLDKINILIRIWELNIIIKTALDLPDPPSTSRRSS